MKTPEPLRSKRGPSDGRKTALAFGLAFALLALPAWFVPQRTLDARDTDAGRFDQGPASYFHHFYDPDGLLGPVGKIDLDLDTFQRQTSHAILVAAFARAPSGDAGFTLRVAEKWRPGGRGIDDGLILFVFTQERRIRAEVGYGLEGDLPDAELSRILNGPALPALRAGDYVGALTLATAAVMDRLKDLPARGPRSQASPFAAMLKGLQQAPRAARKAGAALLAASFAERLVAAFLAVLLGGFALSLIADAAASMRATWLAFRNRGHLEGAKQAAGTVIDLGLKASKVAILLFAIAIGGSYFYAGTGQFGGGGVDVVW